MLAATAALAVSLSACVGPQGPSTTELRGRNAIEEGRFTLARKYLEATIAERPDDLDLLTMLARAWSSGTMQSPVRAIAAWKRCHELEPSLQAALGISRGHLLLGAYSEALAALEDIEANVEVALLRGEALLHLDLHQAMSEIAAAVERFPDEAPLRNLAGRTFHLAEEYETALAHLTRALELDPLDSGMHYLEGRIRQQLGDADGAAAALARHELTSRLAGSGGWPEAATVEKLRMVERLAMNSPGVDVSRIEWLVTAGRRDEAIGVAERLLSADGARPQELLRAESSLIALGRFELAQALLDRVRLESPDPAANRELIYRRARILHLAGDPQGALAEIETVLAADPWVARFVDLQARIEQAAGNDEAAAASLARALDLAPWRVDSRLTLAEIELRRGRPDDAATLLSAAPEPSPAINEFRRRHGLQ